MNQITSHRHEVASYEPCGHRVGSVLRADEDGTVVTEQKVFLADADMDHHMAVLGGTGSGKSKFLERLMRCFMVAGRGFCFIDPHGDTVEDLLAYAAWQKNVEGDDSLWRRIHPIEPSYEMVFGYDPFKYRPLHEIPEQFRDVAYEAWLHTKVDRVSEIIQRKQNQMGFEGMPRLQRILRDVLYATGRAVDPQNRHLPLADALVLLDLQHPRHADVFNRVAPFLDRDVLSDFEVLHKFARVEDLRRETESTVNRLRSLLGPIVKGIFSETVNTIDFTSVIQRGEILLVSLRESDYFSADQANAIGGLFIHEILSAARNSPREKRREFSLIIDEVGEYIGEDLLRALGAVRKYKLSLVFAGQDLSTFQKGDLDLAPKVLSQCGTVVCFQQTYKKDLEILADRVGRGNLDFEELYQVMDRPDGYELLDMEDYSDSFQWQENWTEGGALNHTDTKTRTKSRQVAQQETWSHGRTHQEAQGHVDSAGGTKNKGESRRIVPPRMSGIPTRDAVTENSGSAEHASHADSRTSADGTSDQEGGGITASAGVADAEGGADGAAVNFGIGGSRGGGSSVSRRKQVIQKTREEWHPTGRFRTAVPDQFEIMMTQIYRLMQGQCVVKLKGRVPSFAMQVAHVKEMWAEANKFGRIEKLKKELHALHPYFIPLAVGNAAQQQRIDEYVQRAPEDSPPTVDGASAFGDD